MAIQSLYPAIKPSLNLDFANSRKLDPRITFTRASSARFYDGKTVAKAEENIHQRSTTIGGTGWERTNATLTQNTADTTAPDGTSTALKLVDDATSGSHRVITATGTIPLVTLVNTNYVASVHVKAGTLDFVYLTLGNSVTSNRYATIVADLSTGTISQTDASASSTLVSSGIQTLANGWFRIFLVASQSTTAFNRIAVGSAPAASGNTIAVFGEVTYVGTGESIYLWGPQVEQRSAVTAYTATTTQPITNYVPALQAATDNVARFDHSPTTGESLGLLIEEQRTNLLLRSEEFDNASWTKTRSSITANTIVAPDGTLTGDKLVEDTTASNTHFTQSPSISFTSGTSYSLSIYSKVAERTNLRFFFPSAAFTSTLNAYFDLAAGASYSLSTGVSATITAVGNGWYRCTATAAATATASGVVGFTIVSGGGASTTISYTGDGYAGIYIWGAQLEAGAFPTSYINTEGATATRSADAASMTGANFSSWFNPAGGAVYVEAASPGVGARVAFGMDNDATSNRFEVYSSTLDPKLLVRSGGTDQADIDAGSITAGTAFRFAAAYAVNDFGASVNGGAAVTDTSGILPVGVDRARIGAGQAGNALNARIRKISYYPARLSNANLQALTT